MAKGTARVYVVRARAQTRSSANSMRVSRLDFILSRVRVFPWLLIHLAFSKSLRIRFTLYSIIYFVVAALTIV